MGCIWETIAFVTRALGAHNQQSNAFALISTLFLLLAPLWVNAFCYMTLGRMVHFYLPDKTLCGIKAPSLAVWFVCFDVFSFIVQVAGGIMLSPGASKTTVKIGIDVYMAGIGFQEAFIIGFFGLVIYFQRQMAEHVRNGTVENKRGWKLLCFTLYAVLALITMRIIYRLIEYSRGTASNNPLPFHEVYTYVLDAMPMLIAITTLNVLHPGRFLVGPDAQFPARKERKAAKKEEKAAKKEAKLAKKEGREPKTLESQDWSGSETQEVGPHAADLEMGTATDLPR
jgi:RTA1 like protein